MKLIKFITTFSNVGYNLYGKTWIDTFLENAASENITADIYVDFPLNISNKCVNILDYDSMIPNHKQWCEEFDSSYSDGNGIYAKKMGVRFSYKSFVMMHALENNKNCYVIWLDGDCIFKRDIDFSSFPESILNGCAIAGQREEAGGDDHMESGIVIFDVDHTDTKNFLEKFKYNYQISEIINMSSPYDGFIIYKSLKQSEINYIDLNDGYGKGGIQSDPSQTFLNPEINKRFYHNIGITGKQNYSNWESVSKKDIYFKLIKNSAPPKTIEQIRNIKIDLLNRRKNKQ